MNWELSEGGKLWTIKVGKYAGFVTQLFLNDDRYWFGVFDTDKWEWKVGAVTSYDAVSKDYQLKETVEGAKEEVEEFIKRDEENYKQYIWANHRREE